MFLYLTIFLISLIPSSLCQEPRPLQPPSTQGDCEKPYDTNAQVSCEQEILERLGGCCSTLFNTAQSCSLPSPTGTKGKCPEGQECYEVGFSFEEVPKDPKDPKGTYNGKCHSSPLKNDYTSLKLYNRTGFKKKLKKKKVKPLLGHKCSREPYVKWEIDKLWRRFLICPFDTMYFDREFGFLKEMVRYNKKFLSMVCLASPNMEECLETDVKLKNGTVVKEGRCQCLQEIFYEEDNPNNGVVLNFTQVNEANRSCGQYAGNSCVHNVFHLKYHAKDDKIYKDYKCDVTDIKGQRVLETLPCERDAGCENLLKPDKACQVNDTQHPGKAFDKGPSCTCICAEGFDCNKSDKAVLSWAKLAMFILVLSIVN